ncbi:MAG: hypothetical protein ACYDHP_14485 [Ferrimicrobium sp.]
MCFKVEGHLDTGSYQVSDGLVGRPPGAPGQRVGRGHLQGLEEGRGFGGKALRGTGSIRFSAHGEQAKRQIVRDTPNRLCSGFDRVAAVAAASEESEPLSQGSAACQVRRCSPGSCNDGGVPAVRAGTGLQAGLPIARSWLPAEQTPQSVPVRSSLQVDSGARLAAAPQREEPSRRIETSVDPPVKWNSFLGWANNH